MQRYSESVCAALPRELTTFIGREHECAQLRSVLQSTRLLTLSGPAGSGKTRLAMEVVRDAVNGPTEIAWVQLAPLADARLVVPQIAIACGIREEIHGGDAHLLARRLASRDLVLVLDNCEHLVDTCAAVADKLLRECRTLRIVTTSREALGVSGERAWLVPTLRQDERIMLFAERARDFAGYFELTEQNSPIVAEICTRLDGIPLAIELAAARTKHMTLEQLRDRLSDAFRVLTSGYRTTTPRHRTLTAAMDWSFNLLCDDERTLFCRLGVFRGGFDLDAVEAVGDNGQDVIDLLSRLIDRSLVVVREHRGSARYHLLEPVRQYARARLAESGEEAEIRRRHAEFVDKLVSSAEPHLLRRERPGWVERLTLDLDNIREALTWSREASPQLHIMLAGRLRWFWGSTCHWTEGANVFAGALALPAAKQASLHRARLLFGAGALAALQARPDAARPALEEALELALRAGDACLVAYAQTYLGMTYTSESRPEGQALCQTGAAWFAMNDEPYGERVARILLAFTALAQNRLADAATDARRAVEIARTAGTHRDLAISLETDALVHLARGDLQQAYARFFESLESSRQEPSYFNIPIALDGLAEVLGHMGQPLTAARLLGAAAQLRTVIGAKPFRIMEARLALAVPIFSSRVGKAAFDQAWAAGELLTVEEVLAEVTSAPRHDFAAPLPPRAIAEHVSEVVLEVHALGLFRVVVEGVELSADAWAFAKPKELLVYMLLHPSGSTRDTIARALWPAATPSQLKNSFHVALHHLRKILGHAEWIIVDADRYRLASDISFTFDADIFERAAQVALDETTPAAGRLDRLRDAVALYRGDLLEGDAAGDWLEEDSARLRRLYIASMLDLGQAWEENGKTEPAAEVYQKIIARDDLQEEAHRRLMRCWTTAGDRSRAIRHYQRLCSLLRETLDSAPEAETLAVFEQIRNSA